MIFFCAKCLNILETNKSTSPPICECSNQMIAMAKGKLLKLFIANFNKQKEQIIKSNEKIAQLNEIREKQNILIKNLHANTKNNEIGKYQQEITNKNQSIAKYKQEITNKNKTLQSNNSTILNYKKEIKKLKAQIPKVLSKKEQKEIANTDKYMQKEFLKPLADKIKVDFNLTKPESIIIDPEHNNTQGLFDEIAILLCENIKLVEPMLKAINHNYRNNKLEAVFNITKFNNQELSKINSICSELKRASFVANIRNSNLKTAIILRLHKNETLERFFNGIYLEWFVFMECIKQLEALNKPFSISRSVVIEWNDGRKNEFDVVFVLNNQLVIIECKSGEIRDFVSKYSNIKKQAKLPNEVVCLVANNLQDIESLKHTQA